MEDCVGRTQGTGKVLTTVEVVVGHGPVDEAVERVKGSSQEGQEVAHGGDDRCEDESDCPDTSGDENPRSPALDCVAVLVRRVAHNSAVNVLSCDVGVDGTDDQGRHDDGAKRDLLVHLLEGAECRCSSVLAQEGESESGRNDEQDEGHNGKGSQSLGEILRATHFTDESREEQLRLARGEGSDHRD